jgi:hypothetical protein
MRRAFVAIALSFLVLTSPLASAQFQEPTKEELSTTDDPGSPGVDAVYLYQEQATDGVAHTLTFYDRIKILREKGKELGTIHLGYWHGQEKVVSIEGRTIHADGTVVQLKVKPDDLMAYKEGAIQVNDVAFALPSVEVGSILEYRVKFEYLLSINPQPVWEIQQEYPVRKAHYSFHPFWSSLAGRDVPRLMYGGHIGTAVKVNHDSHKDIYTLDLTNIPPYPKEDWMPPLTTIRWRVRFYYTDARSTDDFWQEALKQWGKDAQDLTKVTGGIKKIAAGLVAATDTDEQKARKIYAAVQSLDNFAFSREKSKAERKKEGLKDIKTLEDVWKRRSGWDDDIAALYVALARAAGVKVYPAQVVDRSQDIFDDRYFSLDQLDNYVAIVVLDGKEVYLDPGEKMCPFGLLHWKHTLTSGFRMTDKGPALVQTPAGTYKDAVVQRVSDLALDPGGSVKGTVRYIMSGSEALYWRQLALVNDADEVKKQFNEAVQSDLPNGVYSEFDHFLGLDDEDTNLAAIVKLSGTLGASTGKRFFLPALVFQARARHPFVSADKRVTPIDVHYARTEEDSFFYHLPPGYNLESPPQKTNASWLDHAALKVSWAPTPDGMNIQRALVYNFAMLDPSEYSRLHDFYQKVATVDQQPFVLTRGEVAHGN